MAKIYLVRHAKAGERRLWEGDDLHRPLSPKGWKQSELLAQRLAALNVSTLHSSPYLRCVQTLEPLAERLQRSIALETWLCEDEPHEPVVAMLAEVPDGAVLSTHGDVIPATMTAHRAAGHRGPDATRLAQGDGVGAQTQQERDDRAGRRVAPARAVMSPVATHRRV